MTTRHWPCLYDLGFVAYGDKKTTQVMAGPERSLSLVIHINQDNMGI